MHPSIALQVAELELERDKAPHGHLDPEEEQRWKEMQMRRPAPFLHFGPRWHQKRRTMTGVLAGYFDLPPRRNEPLPTIPGAQHLLARTAAPAMTEEELERLELENRKRRRGRAVPKRVREIVDVTDIVDSYDGADLAAGVVVAEDPRRSKGGQSSANRSLSRSRSDSPLTTDFKPVSDESTPPLTPMSSRSRSSYRLPSDEEKTGGPGNKETKTHKGEAKTQKRGLHKSLTFDGALGLMPTTTELRDTVETEKKAKSTSASLTGSAAREENKTNAKTGTNARKRKFSEIERPLQRSRGTTTASTKEQQTKAQQEEQKEQQRQRRKSRPGWKGWVEVEGSPEPMTKLINLDFPIETLEKRTRSGKVMPAGTPDAATGKRRGRPSIPRSSTGASVTPAPDGPSVSSSAAFEGKEGGDGPLGAISGNTPVATLGGNAGAEV